MCNHLTGWKGKKNLFSKISKNLNIQQSQDNLHGNYLNKGMITATISYPTRTRGILFLVKTVQMVFLGEGSN